MARRPWNRDVGSVRRKLRGAIGPNSGMLIALVVLFVVMTLWAPNFLTEQNLTNVARQLSYIGIVAIGMTFVIIAGEIDISVGAAIAFGSSLLGVLVADHGWAIPVAVLAVLAVGTAIGVGAGLLRAVLGVPSFIVTLALLSILAGGALAITDGLPHPVIGEGFEQLGLGEVAGIPVPTLMMAGVFLLGALLLHKTTFGRSVYAVGGNADAARLAGIPIVRVRTVIFAMTGFLSACSAVLITAQLSTGSPQVSSGAEFEVISAVIVGGASLYGGRGTMLGTLLGIVFIAVLTNGMVLLGVDSNAQRVAYGVIVLIAVLLTLRPLNLRRSVVRAASSFSRG